jgi:hypothetical protein
MARPAVTPVGSASLSASPSPPLTTVSPQRPKLCYTGASAPVERRRMNCDPRQNVHHRCKTRRRVCGRRAAVVGWSSAGASENGLDVPASVPDHWGRSSKAHAHSVPRTRGTTLARRLRTVVVRTASTAPCDRTHPLRLALAEMVRHSPLVRTIWYWLRSVRWSMLTLHHPRNRPASRKVA